MSDHSTIQVSNELKKFLDKNGSKGESYDQVLKKLLKDKFK
jgi:hypothetical protein